MGYSNRLDLCTCEACAVRKRWEAGEPLGPLLEGLRDRAGHRPGERNRFGRRKRFYAGADFPCWTILEELGQVKRGSGNFLFRARCKGCGVVREAFGQVIAKSSRGCSSCSAKAQRADPGERCSSCNRTRAETQGKGKWGNSGPNGPECCACDRRARRNGRDESGLPRRHVAAPGEPIAHVRAWREQQRRLRRLRPWRPSRACAQCRQPIPPDRAKRAKHCSERCMLAGCRKRWIAKQAQAS